MEIILLVVHLLLAVTLIITVLLQHSEGGGLGIGGGGSMGGLVSVRGTTNFLTRATAVLAVLFMTTSMTLAILASQRNAPQSILDRPAATEQAPRDGELPISK